MYSPSSEATEEIKILSNTFSAENGKSGGAVVTLALKSGTNHFHGSLFEFLRNDLLDANAWFSNATRTGKSNQNIFGGALGGPVWKNHTFFFFDYQGFRQISAGQPTRSTLPTLDMGRGDFSNLRNARSAHYDLRSVDRRTQRSAHAIRRQRYSAKPHGSGGAQDLELRADGAPFRRRSSYGAWQ